jgi:sulfopropanediol 3-dehydrogenase
MSSIGLESSSRVYLKRAEPHIYAAQRKWNLLPNPNPNAAPGRTFSNVKASDTDTLVRTILDDIILRREEGALYHAKQFDSFEGNPIVEEHVIDAAVLLLTAEQKQDIEYAHDRISTFAKAQRANVLDTDVELSPGFRVGSKFVPVSTAGCYVPGGRYAHIASALMTVATAKAAGVQNVRVTTPVRSHINVGGKLIPSPHPAVLYALRIAGADQILCLGGVQGIAALGLGLFDGPPADIIAGPGNKFVASAKRLLFSEHGVGMDLVAGPTEVVILADETSNAEVVAWDLASQCEHGPASPAVLITRSKQIGEQVAALMPTILATLPSPNRETAQQAWKTCGEIVWCSEREAACVLSDEVASEHLQVMCNDLNFYHERLQNYGSLFLGSATTVSMGDKASGPNHVLPTMRAARYTGGLSVLSFLKCLSWQRPTAISARDVANVTASISRMEGMEGHARAADLRSKM